MKGLEELLLASILSQMLNPNPRRRGKEADPLSGAPDEIKDQMAEYFMSQKPFIPLDEKLGTAAWTKLLRTMADIDPANVDSVFVSILVKNPQPEGEPCPGCGEVHDGVEQILSIIGDEMTIRQSVRRGLARGVEVSARMSMEHGNAVLRDKAGNIVDINEEEVKTHRH